MSPMPGNTEEHQLRLKERRAVLTQTLGGILQPGQGFVWEVGSGHGHFLTALAQSNPAQTFIGIDIAKDRVARGQRKQARARLPRLHFLQAEATDFLEALPPGNVIEATYILFPDPWPDTTRIPRTARLTQRPTCAIAFQDRSLTLLPRRPHPGCPAPRLAPPGPQGVGLRLRDHLPAKSPLLRVPGRRTHLETARNPLAAGSNSSTTSVMWPFRVLTGLRPFAYVKTFQNLPDPFAHL